MSSSLHLMVASVVKSPTMIRVTLLCGRLLSGRALWRAMLAATTTLKTCLERPFTRTIANIPLHLKLQKECSSSSTIARYFCRMNYCTNYCNSQQLLQRHPLRNLLGSLLRTPKKEGLWSCLAPPSRRLSWRGVGRGCLAGLTDLFGGEVAA